MRCARLGAPVRKRLHPLDIATLADVIRSGKVSVLMACAEMMALPAASHRSLVLRRVKSRTARLALLVLMFRGIGAEQWLRCLADKLFRPAVRLHHADHRF